MKLKNWLDIWLTDTVKPTLKETTYDRYKKIAYSHLVPRLGEYELSELTPITLQNFVSYLSQTGNCKTRNGLSSSTVNTIITVLQEALKSAVTLGELENYNGNKIRRPKNSDKEITCFTANEQRKIEQYIVTKRKVKLFGIILCMYSGLRIGELLALEWSDVNFNSGTLTVSKTCYYGKSENGKYGRQTGLPKTATSQREIPLPKQITAELKTLKRRSQSEYLVANGTNPISVRSYQRSFTLLLEKLKIPHRNFHSLRHTFATRAVECGMDVKTLAEILGHKDAKVTLDKYVRSLLEHKKEMMNRVGKLFR